MSDPQPPTWLKPMNKLLMGVQKLGVVPGPSGFSRCPAGNRASCAVPRRLRSSFPTAFTS
jgi:hypothetical protein